MTQRSVRWFTGMMLTLIGCSEVHPRKVEDDQMDSLRSCENSRGCGSEMECVCVPKASAGCELAGVHYEPGASVPSGDCNACTCNTDGSFQCTTIACPIPAAEPATRAQLPAKDGVPIGDCVELSASELAAQGCPAAEPAVPSTCDVVGKTCRYPLRVMTSTSVQPVYVCDGHSWGPGSLAVCGRSCGDVSGGQTIDLNASGCGQRPSTACDDGQGTAYSYAPPGYTLADAMLQKALEACGADLANSPVELAFEEGCPVRLSAQRMLTESVVACLKAQLEDQRWECATQLPCVFRAWGPT